VYGLRCARPTGKNVIDRRLGIRVDVQVVGQIALGIEIDREHAEADSPEDIGQRPDSRRLAGSAFLGENSDRRRHRRRL